MSNLYQKQKYIHSPRRRLLNKSENKTQIPRSKNGKTDLARNKNLKLEGIHEDQERSRSKSKEFKRKPGKYIKSPVSRKDSKRRSSDISKKKRTHVQKVIPKNAVHHKKIEAKSSSSLPDKTIILRNLYKEYEKKINEIDDSYKIFLINTLIKPCYICSSNATYYIKGFFCLDCIRKFEAVVITATTIYCSNNGECTSKKNCRFCLTEVFYLHGIRASDVIGFEYNQLDYFQINSGSGDEKEPSLEDKSFCNYFNNILNYILDWLWNQGDLLKLTPGDRMSLLRTNSGRARILWIVIDCIPRHGVIKTEDGYLEIENFCWETIVKTIVDINDMSLYISSLSFTPQHLYYVKLLSVFYIGKCIDCTFNNTLNKSCHCREATFDRGSQIKIMSENYCKLLKEMNVHDGDIELITNLIDLMHSMNEIISEEDMIDDVRLSLKNWEISHPDRAKSLKESIPSPFSIDSTQRHDLTRYFNVATINFWQHAQKYIQLFFSSRDQKTLFYHYMKQMVVVYMCWKSESLFEDNDKSVTGNLTKNIWMELRDIQNSIKKIRKLISLPDFQFMFLTRENQELENNLKDVDINKLGYFMKRKQFENMDRNFKMNHREARMKSLHTSIHIIMHKVNKMAASLELLQGVFPLLIDVKSWITETQ